MSDRSLLGQTPIPGGSPAGEPLSGDDEFDVLRAEITRDPVLGEPVSWKVVTDLSEKLLSERSKDFTVACYFAVGLIQTEGLVGLRDGLKVVSDMAEHFWDVAFPPAPKRIRGRVNALGFLSEKGSPVVAAIEPRLEDADRVSECDDLLADIERIFGERAEGLEIPLGDLARAMRDLKQRVPSAPASPSESREPGAAAAQAHAPHSGAPAAPASGGSPGMPVPGEIKSRSDIESLLLRVSTFLKNSNAQDPLGYRLPRIVDFSEITSEPPDDGGRLMIPGPDASGMSAMRNLWAASDWQGLVEAADNVCRSSPLCLDAHRYCSEGLAALGGPYRAAADGIRDEVKSLLKRAPRLIRLHFSDGTPLADSATQDWVRDEATEPGPAVSTNASEIDPEELDAARKEAKDLARKGELAAALARLESTLAADASPRGRFLGRLELAELCVGTGHDRVALPMLSELDEILMKHGLETWEPSLSRRLLALYYQCRKRHATGEDESEEALARAEKLYDRLCRVDPVAAAALD